MDERTTTAPAVNERERKKWPLPFMAPPNRNVLLAQARPFPFPAEVGLAYGSLKSIGTNHVEGFKLLYS
jgi:hypothetical protein